jgi:hypothetical protein
MNSERHGEDMSPLESRAWLSLWGMCPPYCIYFALQIAAPAWLTTTPGRFICLAAAAGVHALVCLTGLVVLVRRERGHGLLADERDRAIEAHATRIAYYALMVGTVLVGMVMPFSRGGWQIVNGALLAIVLAEALRNALIVRGYRGTPRLAQ